MTGAAHQGTRPALLLRTAGSAPRRILSVIGVAGLLAPACGPQDHRAGAAATLTVLMSGDERVLGLPYDMSAKFLVFLPLTAENADGELEPRLAQSWQHAPDYREWTVRLRSDLRWHDGIPVTAHDVKFTLDLMKHPRVRWAGPGDYDVRVLDDTTYTIAYRKRGPGNPLDTWTVYYPRHLLEHLDPTEFENWEFWIRPVGNGPYRYVRHLPGAMLELEANPDFYRGTPRIERVVLKFGGQPLAELLSGNVDVMTTEADLLKVADDSRFTGYYRFEAFAAQALVWNHRDPAFRDRRVRRALTLAIDRNELLQVLNLPRGTPLGDVLHTERQFRRGETPPPLPHDSAEAARLLDEAGWRDRDGDGIRERDGRPFRFSVLVPGAGSERAAVYVQSQLRRLGIVMEVETLEIRALFARVREAQFEAVLSYVHMRGEPGAGALHFEEDSPIGYVNPQVASRLRQARSAFDPAEVDRLYRELWPIFQADVPVTFLHPLVRTTIAHRRVRGLVSPDRIDPVADMEAVWLER